MRNVIFLGYAISEEELSELLKNDTKMPVQTVKFSWSLLKSLSSCLSSDQLKVLSALPCSDYPSNSRIFVTTKSYFFNGFFVSHIPFINISVLKTITRFFSSFITLISKVSYQDVLVVHGIHNGFLLSFFLIKFIKRSKIVVVFTDPPSNPDDFKGIIKYLRLIDVMATKILLSKFDGAIVLSPYSKEEFFHDVKSIVVEGFSPFNKLLNSSYDNVDGDLNIAYMGILSERYGIKELVDAFKLLSYKESKCAFNLILCGRGDLEDYIKDASFHFKNIIFKGFLDQQELETVVDNAHLFINPRPVGQDFTLHSFPSKTLEYMSFGLPVITTRLESIPKEYDEYLLYLDSNTPEEIANRLIELSFKDRSLLRDIGLRSRDFVMLNKTSEAFGMKINDFLKEL
jgi:glycosyltransferase involved in cell wall biosynthesis